MDFQKEELDGKVAQAIRQALSDLSHQYLGLENESAKHAGYYPGKESHFKLTVVSDEFVDKRRIARHQMVYARVNNLLTQGGGQVHALAIHAFTPAEWQNRQELSPDSPQCAGRHS